MTQRHRVQSGKIMFITTNVYDRECVFENPSWAREAVAHLYRVKEKMPFALFGFVIMPGHCHFLLRVIPPGRISNVMRTYKMGLNFQIGVHGGIWQPRFYLEIPDDPHAVLQYIHQNPVKAELCKKPEDYPWSSASGKWGVEPLPIDVVA